MSSERNTYTCTTMPAASRRNADVCTCPICRQPFRVSDLIRVLLPDPAQQQAQEAEDRPLLGGKLKVERDERASQNSNSGPPREGDSISSCEFSSAVEEETLKGIPYMYDGGRTRFRNPKFPSLSPMLLSHLYAATGGSALHQGQRTGLLPSQPRVWSPKVCTYAGIFGIK